MFLFLFCWNSSFVSNYSVQIANIHTSSLNKRWFWMVLLPLNKAIFSLNDVPFCSLVLTILELNLMRPLHPTYYTNRHEKWPKPQLSHSSRHSSLIGLHTFQPPPLTTTKLKALKQSSCITNYSTVGSGIHTQSCLQWIVSVTWVQVCMCDNC